jgi:hypothetical protein
MAPAVARGYPQSRTLCNPLHAVTRGDACGDWPQLQCERLDNFEADGMKPTPPSLRRIVATMGVIRRAIIFALGLALGLAAASPLSRAATVQELLRECTEGKELELHCIGYVGGIGEVMQLMGASIGFGICSTGTITHGAIQQAFENWAKKHPENWGDRAPLGVMLALRETWPCK